MRDWRDPKFEVRGLKFRKPRTSDLEPSPVSPVPPFPLVVHRLHVSRFRHHSFWRRTWIAKTTAFALPLFLAALTCSVAFGSSGQFTESTTEAVHSTLTKIFRILKDEKLKDPAKLTPRQHILEEVIAFHFDYREMAKRSLAAVKSDVSIRDRPDPDSRGFLHSVTVLHQ